MQAPLNPAKSTTMTRTSRLCQYSIILIIGFVLRGFFDVIFFDIDKVLSDLKIEIIKNENKLASVSAENPCFGEGFEREVGKRVEKILSQPLSQKSQVQDTDVDVLHEIAIENYENHPQPQISQNQINLNLQSLSQENIKKLLNLNLKAHIPPSAFKPKNEYEVTRWDVIIGNNVYSTDVLGLGEPRIGLNGKFLAEKLQLEEFLGVKIKSFYRREDIFRGIDYLVDTAQNERIRVLKPLYPEMKILSKESHQNVPTTVHLIMPVSKVADRLRKFLEKFKNDNLENVHLTLVSMSEKPKASDGDVKKLVEQIFQNSKISNINVIEVDEPFNRGRALNIGSNSLNRLSLIFFMDVDITFTKETLDRCRNNAKPDKSVWFPIVFNQYDPKIIINGNPPGRADISSNQDPNPKLMEINKWTGFWIHYGFGMICLYKSDFDAVGKFPEIAGWGGEDVGIYRNFIKNNYERLSNLEVIHSVEPGMVHIYHDRKCDRSSLSDEQYRMCMGATSETIGNRQQLAVMYLKSEGLL